MTKPNTFIMNTDYMSIAQTDKYTHTYTVNGGTVPAYGQLITHTDFTVPSQKGAIDRIFVSVNDGPLKLGTRCGFLNIGYVDFYRIAPNTLRAELVISNGMGSTPITYPLLKFVIKGVMFRPPNVF